MILFRLNLFSTGCTVDSMSYLAKEETAFSSQFLRYGPAHHGAHHAPHHEGGDYQRVDEITILPAQIYVVVALW